MRESSNQCPMEQPLQCAPDKQCTHELERIAELRARIDHRAMVRRMTAGTST